MTPYEMELFIGIYEWLNEVMERTHKGRMIEQAVLMDGAIRLMEITLSRDEEETTHGSH